MRLLLVEDEENLADVLLHIFKRNKYEADAVHDGITAEEMIMNGMYDIIILDRMIPGQDGVALLKNIRKKGVKTPVLFLTAKHTTADKIEGLDAGADDYLTKPFSNDELMARVRALSRRSGEVVETEEIIIGKSKFMPRRSELLFGRNYSSSLTLTLKETGILETLSQNPGVPVTKEELLQRLWGPENDGDVNIVEVFVSYLRKKIKPEQCGFSIVTQRNLGYKIVINK
ncbi:MAG: response regulator transcription factor [Oscillospiraceae bacterium]|nr:response regulator transcription factor [Oscillospiraceae bacterium]